MHFEGCFLKKMQLYFSKEYNSEYASERYIIKIAFFVTMEGVHSIHLLSFILSSYLHMLILGQFQCVVLWHSYLD